MTDSDQIEAGREAWQRIRESGRSFDDWIVVAKALQIGRDVALQEAGTDRPYGTYYTRAMTRWLRQAGLAGIADTERSRALRVLANLPAILVWRDGLDEAQRRRHNHPDGVYTCWRRSITVAETAERQDVVPPKPAAQRQDAVAKVAAPAGTTSRYSKPKAIYWSQDAIKRAAMALRECYSNDTFVMARRALEAAIRFEADLLELLPAPPAEKKPRQVAALAALELQ